MRRPMSPVTLFSGVVTARNLRRFVRTSAVLVGSLGSLVLLAAAVACSGSSNSTAPPVDGGIGLAAPTSADGALCVSPPIPDAGGGDGGACPPPATSECTPADVGSFPFTWRPPTGSHQGKCTADDAAKYVSCLFHPG